MSGAGLSGPHIEMADAACYGVEYPEAVTGSGCIIICKKTGCGEKSAFGICGKNINGGIFLLAEFGYRAAAGRVDTYNKTISKLRCKCPRKSDSLKSTN